jgi:hypothetical protein
MKGDVLAFCPCNVDVEYVIDKYLSLSQSKRGGGGGGTGLRG